MSSLNKVILIGRLGKDPETRVMQNSKEMVTFSLVTSEVWKDKSSGEKVEKKEWHNVVVFSEGLVKIAQQFLRKGSRVYIEGAIKSRKWLDNNENEKSTIDIVLSNFSSTLILLDNKGSTGNSDIKEDEKYSTSLHQNFDKFNSDDIDDEIPF